MEQSREAGGRSFHAGNALAELDLREIVVRQSQPQVWQRVDAINQRLGLAPPTHTYRLAARAQSAERAAALGQRLAALPDRASLIGLAVAIDGNVIAIDRFASPELYQQLEGELLRSYVASDALPPHEGHPVVPDDVRRLAASPQLSTTTDASFVVLTTL